MKINRFALALLLSVLAVVLAPRQARATNPITWTPYVYTDPTAVQIPFKFGKDVNNVYNLQFPSSVTTAQQNEVIALPQFNNQSVSGSPPTVTVGPLFPPGPGSPANFITSDVPESANFNVTSASYGIMYQVTTGASNITATIPAAATLPDGFYFFLRKADSGAGLILNTALSDSVGIQGHVTLYWTDGASWYGRAWYGGFDVSGDLSETAAGNITLTPGTGFTVATGIAGTAAAPVQTLTDATTGWYRPAANQWAFSGSGSEVFIFSSSGISTAAATSLGINPGTTGALNLATTNTGAVNLGNSTGATTLKGSTITFSNRALATTTASLPGFNLGTYAGNPSTLVNGDIWANTTSNAINAYIGGSIVTLGATGSAGISGASAGQVLVATGAASGTGYAGFLSDTLGNVRMNSLGVGIAASTVANYIDVAGTGGLTSSGYLRLQATSNPIVFGFGTSGSVGNSMAMNSTSFAPWSDNSITLGGSGFTNARWKDLQIIQIHLTASTSATGGLSLGYNGTSGSETLSVVNAGSGNSTFNTGITEGSATLITTTTSFTNGAASGAGTLTNAPAAGNPTKWIPVNDNGTTRYIPAW